MRAAHSIKPRKAMALESIIDLFLLMQKAVIEIMNEAKAAPPNGK